MMPRYDIVNLITKETVEIDADLASDACERLGWPIRSCRVDLQPAVDPPGKRNKVSFVSDDASSDQHRLLVLMALLGALVGGLSGLGSGIAIIGAIFGAFIYWQWALNLHVGISPLGCHIRSQHDSSNCPCCDSDRLGDTDDL